MSSEDDVPAKPAKPASNPWKMISLVLVIVVLVAGAGGAGVWWSRRGGATVEAKAAAPVVVTAAEAHGIVPLQPFLVNLADQGGNQFLRTTIQLVVPQASQADTIKKDDVTLMRIRSAILELLTQQQANALVTPQGKQALKKAISDRVDAILGTVPVVDVLFSDFVVQF
ncbi:MAG TPA: flagellar basal body-associated FliL family protein [Vicinamibacterales bacterium]|nr:flagellar basal body-associated FliL family protein [Vicinamibacterales bacterium]